MRKTEGEQRTPVLYFFIFLLTPVLYHCGSNKIDGLHSHKHKVDGGEKKDLFLKRKCYLVDE